MPAAFLLAIFATPWTAHAIDGISKLTTIGCESPDQVCHSQCHEPATALHSTWSPYAGIELAPISAESSANAISMLQRKSYAMPAQDEDVAMNHSLTEHPMLIHVQAGKEQRSLQHIQEGPWGQEAVMEMVHKFNRYSARVSDAMMPESCRRPPKANLQEVAGGAELQSVCQMQRAPSQYLAQAIALYLRKPTKKQDPTDPFDQYPLTDLETLFRKEDLDEWLLFTVVFILLVAFDNVVLFRADVKMNFLIAILYTSFWVCCGFLFLVYVYRTRGTDAAVLWTSGYFLEWMLSVDNLFIFHQIFRVFGTPDNQKHKPLFYGIVGAIFFRLSLFLVEDVLMIYVSWMHVVFGLFLVYTGTNTLLFDDDDEDFSLEDNAFLSWVVSRIPYIDRYDSEGGFLTKVSVDKPTGSIVDRSPSLRSLQGSFPVSDRTSSEDAPDAGTGGLGSNLEVKWYATRLVVVLICLELTDLVFAVDSVSAIVAQIPDLFLSYTACVFAMLGLRAMFFAIDELVKLFTMLKYGVGLILIFLGLKLIAQKWVDLPPSLVCAIMFTTLALSVLASIVSEYFDPDAEERPKEEAEAELKT